MPTRKHLLMTLGDPAGIGPEVLLQTLAKRWPTHIDITVFGDQAFLKDLAQQQGVRVSWKRYAWQDVYAVSPKLKRGAISQSAGRAAFAYLEAAAACLAAGDAHGVVTAPICKEAIVKSQSDWIGHTEYLAEVFGVETTMMFLTGSFRASLVTTHVAIQDLPKTITRQKVKQAVQATRQALKQQFGIRKPRIGVASLNPHAGEGGMFGDEEKRVVLPVLKAFPEVQGPLPVDTLMAQAHAGHFDAVVALYHDQALIPVKLLGWDKAVNVTLGLPIVRTSPVHGTAFDLVGTAQKPKAASMQAATALACQLIQQQKGRRC